MQADVKGHYRLTIKARGGVTVHVQPPPGGPRRTITVHGDGFVTFDGRKTPYPVSVEFMDDGP